MSKVFKPGQKAPASAQFELVGARGAPKGIEITGVRGKPLPPTPKPNMGYIPVDLTKHKKK